MPFNTQQIKEITELEQNLEAERAKLESLIDIALQKDKNLGRDKNVVKQSILVNDIVNRLHALH